MSNNSAGLSYPSGSKGNHAALSRLGSVIWSCQQHGAKITGEGRSRVPWLHLKLLFGSLIFPSFCPASYLSVHPSMLTGYFWDIQSQVFLVTLLWATVKAIQAPHLPLGCSATVSPPRQNKSLRSLWDLLQMQILCVLVVCMLS